MKMEVGEIVECSLDEIALEGLEGINIPGLWIRLEQRILHTSTKLDDSIKEFLWKCIVADNHVECFEVPTSPDPLEVQQSKYRLRDPELGVEIGPPKRSGTNELGSVVNDKERNIRGLCAGYNSRNNVTQELRSGNITLSSALEKWGDRLFLVASQHLRNRALFGVEADPEVELSDLHYGILEKLGKSRYLGQLQTEICSSFNIDSKNMFYQRKRLFARGYVTSQNYAIRLSSGRLQNSVLLLLKRFHVDYRSKYDTFAERLSNVLSAQPDMAATFLTVKQELGLLEDSQTFKKMLKHAIGLNLVKTFSTRKEVMAAKHGKKTVAVWHMKLQKSYSAIKDEAGDEEDDEDDENDSILPSVPRVHELPLLNQVYNLVEQHGSNGIPLTKIRKMMNLGRLEIRQLGKNLLRTGTVQQIPHDEGRQRTFRYVSVKHIESSQLRKDLEKEQERSRELQKMTDKVNTNAEVPDVASLEFEPGVRSVGTTPSMTPAGSPLQSAEPSKADTPEPMDTAEGKSEPAFEGDSKMILGSNKMLTARVLRRRNIIIETVRSCKVVRGLFSLLKAVLNAEREEGVNYRCDKKSIIRLVKSLVQEGLIRQFTTIVTTDDGSSRNKVEFITDINIQPSDELVKSAILQTKFRMENVLKQKQEKQDRLEKTLKLRQMTCVSKSTKTSPIRAKKLKVKLKGEKKRTPGKEKTKQKGNKKKKGKTSGEEIDESDEGSSSCENDQHVKLERIKNTSGAIGIEARKYGYLPKMPRLKVIHQYIWYLVYGYKGKAMDSDGTADTKDIKQTDDHVTSEASKDVSGGGDTASQPVEVESEKEKEKVQSSAETHDISQGASKETGNRDSEPAGLTHPQADTATEQVSHETRKMQERTYVDEMDWRRFLPPLPQYNDCGKGWCLVSDLLLWMPLSLFCSIVQLSYKVDNLEDYLNHPIKRFTLLGLLPRNMRIQLLHRRKYVFTFDENLRRLSSMGLIVYGPQKSETKDQVFIYVCQYSVVVDTAPCLPHYNRARGGPFKKKRYNFQTAEQVEQYWFDLQCICLSTPLGVVRKTRKKHPDSPTELTGALSNTIKNLVVAVDDISQPPPQDNGSIPGDGQGAGGMDSSFYTHLKRNWQWLVAKNDRLKQSSTKFGSSFQTLSSPTKAMRDVLVEGVASTSGELTPDALIQLVSEPRRSALKTVSEIGKKRKKALATKSGSKKKLKPTKLAKKTRGPKDAVDVKALEKMTKQRVGWTAQEDSLLLLCKVASTLLNKKKQDFIPWSVVRDILHTSYQISRDKTSAAVNRRSKYILNNPQTALNLKICLAEVYQDKELLQDIMAVKGDYENAEVCATEYRDLVKKMREKFSSLPGELSFDLPDTLEDLHNSYKVVPIGPRSTVNNALVLHSRDDIIKAQLVNLIQISLSMDSSEYNSHQVFKVYEKYRSELLEAAFNSLRVKGLVNRKRPIEGCKTTRHVPFAAMSYQLSVRYQRCFLSLIPVCMFQEFNTFFQELIKTSSDENNQWLNFPSEATGGTVCCIATLMSMNKLALDVVVPYQIVVVDSDLMESQVVAASKQVASNTNSTGASDDSDDAASNHGDVSEVDALTRATMQGESASQTQRPSPTQSKQATTSSKTKLPSTSTMAEPQPSTSKDYVPPTKTSDRDTPTSVSSSQNLTFDVTPRQASRSNLLLYRGQYAPGIVSQRNLNPQDNIVVNSCTVSAAISSKESDNRSRIRFEKDGSLPDTVEISDDPRKMLQLPTERELEDYSKDTIIKRGICALDDVIEKLKGHTEKNALAVPLKVVYELIVDKREFGLPVSDLSGVAEKYGIAKNVMDETVDELLKSSLVIEVGVSEATLVSRQHAAPWLIHSLKLVSKTPTPTGSDGERTSHQRKRARTASYGKKEEMDESRQEDKLEEDYFEPVDFVSHPWLKVEGKANPTTLRKMLQGLLLYIMNLPGISHNNVIDKYNGVLHPVSVQQLLQMLLDIGCISKHIKTKQKCSLFSDPWTKPKDIGGKKAIYYEPTVDCVLKLATIH